ncbi:tape measure protein [Corynebacterium pseudopelargi]|uniref:Chromosome partition protein Smc n=1 Tax=Corynebacterium pseudopelargi TaxID=2080757 RepID=A0A3G6ISR7_9CORY|nr:tape measure protein [Corynebacterium pseudopelargi]AZA08695.1 Chromosome partition protein Smc [Corynebacterium pseudopelargi]
MSGVWIPVLASMKGFIAEVNRGADTAAKSAGQKLNKGLSEATKDGGADAAAKVAKAVEAQTVKISTARKAQAQAAADVQVAEQKLANLRESGTAKASQIAKAESQLETAKVKHKNATAQLQRGEQDLETVRNGGEATASSLARAEDGLASAKAKSVAKQGELRTAETQLNEARDKAKGASEAVQQAELNLINVRDRYGANTRETASAEKQLETAKKQAATADNQVATAAGKVTKARADVANATDNLRAKTMTHKAAQEQVARSERKAGDEAASAGRKIRGMGTDMESANPKAKNLTGSLMGVATKAGVAAGAFLGVQGVTSVLGAGFDRLQNIERAEIGFKNIGLTADETKAQMAKLTEQVTGTSVSLSDAAKYSAMFAQSGVQMGKPMDDTVKAFTNLSAAAAGSGVDVGNVMTQISAAGRLLGGDAMQLQQAGINIYQYVADYMGKSVAEVKKLGEEGKISFEDVVGAVNKGTGDLAKDMGETLSAKMANMKTALASLGAALIEPLMGPLTTAVTAVTGALKALIGPLKVVGGWASEHQTTMTVLGVAFGSLAAGVAAYNVQAKIAAAGGIVKMLTGMAKASKLAAVGQWALNTAMWANPLTWVVAAIAAVVAGLALFFTKTETGRKAWETFTNFLSSAWQATVDALKAAYETFVKPIWEGLVNGAQWAMETLTPVWEGIKAGFNAVKDAFSTGVDWIKSKWDELGTGLGQFKATWLDPIGAAIQAWVNTIVMPAFDLLGQGIKLVWDVLIKPVFDTFMSLAQLVGNIIMIVVNNLIIPAWNTLGSIISSVWNGIIQPVWELIKTAAGILADILTGNFGNIGDRFSSMGQSISDIVHGVINTAMEFFKGIVEMVGNAWETFRDIVGTVVDFVKERIQKMIDNIGEIPGKVQSLFEDAGSWLVNAGRDIISGLWNGMKEKWNSVKNWLSDHLSFSSIGSLVGMSGGGIISFAAGGITEAYVQGGIRQLEAYANGGGREDHRAQIAPAGAWRVWAEDETGGEAYIPLASSKRVRSTAILNEVATRFGYQLIDRNGAPYAGGYNGNLGPQHVTAFADGAVVGPDALVSFVHGRGASRPLEGAPYIFGGSNWGDCSGTQSAVAAKAVGLDPFPRKFATMNEGSWLAAHGFKRGRGGSGDLRIGYMNGGPGGGHTAGTLPNGVNIEMGGARGNGQYGGQAAGAWDSYFTDFYYLPMKPEFDKVALDGLGDLGDDDLTISTTPMGIPDTPGDAAAASMGADTTGNTGTNENTISGMAGNLAKEVVSGHVSDILGVFGVPDTLPSWLTGMRDLKQEYDKAHSDNATGNPRTSLAEDHAAQLHDDAVTSMTPAEMKRDPQLRGADTFDVVEQPKVPEWGPEFFVHEIARQAKAMNLGADGAKIGVATALVESGDPLQMYANNSVPESLKFRHDAVGSDYDSVGLFQQRNNGAWGTVAERMDPFKSAGMFFRELVKFDWRGMQPGDAAQKVQRSAFPDRYAGKMGRAEELVNNVGLFDQGGVLKDKSLALNLSGKPEAVLTNDQWGMLNDLGGSLPSIVGGLTSSAVGSAGMAGIAGVNSVVPGAGAALEPLVGVAADYAGGVTSGWAQAFVTAANQTADIVAEPVRDTVGEFAQPVVDMANQVQTGVREVAGRAQSTAQQVQAKTPININVQNMEQAYEAKRRLEARELAGFM